MTKSILPGKYFGTAIRQCQAAHLTHTAELAAAKGYWVCFGEQLTPLRSQ